MVGDPAELHRLAARVRAEADELRAVAAVVATAAGVPWRSPAAALFRERVHDRVVGLRRAARDADDAADLVAAHARAVAEALGHAEEVARGVVRGAQEVWRG